MRPNNKYSGLANTKMAKPLAATHQSLLSLFLTLLSVLFAGEQLLLKNAAVANALRVSNTPLIMPNVVPEKKDTYYCTAMKLNAMGANYLVGFAPNASTGAAHHIIVHGCESPGVADVPMWECNEMNTDNSDNENTMSMSDAAMAILTGSGSSNDADALARLVAPSSASSRPARGPACGRGGAEQILYAWAHDAPSMKLPDDVGFEVGGPESRIQYLVVQVHYNDHIAQFKEKGTTDDSGVIVSHTSTPTNKRAGVWLFGSNGRLPPKRTEVVDMACGVEQLTELHPFAFRTHTHSHGKVVAAYLVRNGEWTLIGKQDPQKPQMFYPVADSKIVIGPGDVVAARCTFENNEDRTINMGATIDDEMCNFYLMYYTEVPFEPLVSNVCYSWGPPLVYWETMRLPNIPEKHSTSLEGAAPAPEGDHHHHH